MSTPDSESEKLVDDDGWRLAFHPNNPSNTSVMLWLSAPKYQGGREDCISLNVEGLTALSQLAAEWARWLAAQIGETVPEALPADDRERRIRELAREWLGRLARAGEGNGDGYILTAGASDVPCLVETAALLIDALDAAEVPKKEGE